MIDICTVVFEEELPILEVQAQSIDLYCKDIGVNSIFVLVNDRTEVAKKINPAWWGSLQDRVVIIPRSAFDSNWSNNGWVSQQVLKLLGATLSYNTYTMVLDAKTIFISKLTRDRLLNSQQQLNVGKIEIQKVFEPSKKIVEQLFDITVERQAGPGGVPFFFHNNTVRSLIATVSDRISTSFTQWFQEQGMLTEFILYSGFVIYKHGSLDKFYSDNSKFLVSNVCHSEVGIYDIKINQADLNKTALTVSVHRNAWAQLTLEQKSKYREFLASRQINTAWNLI